MEEQSASGDPLYALEKLESAVFILTIGAGTIRERLYEACREFGPVTEEDFPPLLRADFQGIITQLTKSPPKVIRVVRNGRLVEESVGAIPSSLSGMRISKLQAIARRLCELTDRLRDFVEDADR